MLAACLASIALGTASLPAAAAATEADGGATRPAEQVLTLAEAALAMHPDCDPRQLFCVVGQNRIFDGLLSARGHESAKDFDARCPPGKPMSRTCVADRSAVLEQVFQIDEAGLRQRALQQQVERAWAKADLDHMAERTSTLASAVALFRAADCPVSSHVCLLGRWSTLSDLADEAVFRNCEGPFAGDDVPACNRQREAALDWIGSEAVALAERASWPNGAGQGLAEHVAERLEDRPAFWLRFLPLWKAARRQGMALSYAGAEDAALFHAGHKQLNGMIGDCTFGQGPARWTAAPIDDPAHVDHRRAAAGEPPLRTWISQRSAFCRSIDPAQPATTVSVDPR